MAADNFHIHKIKSNDSGNTQLASSGHLTKKTINPSFRNAIVIMVLAYLIISICTVLFTSGSPAISEANEDSSLIADQTSRNSDEADNTPIDTPSEPKTAPSDTTIPNENVEAEPKDDDSGKKEEKLVEGSKYDPTCKKAIADRYGISISSIHWTHTQHEDEPNSKKQFATINYGNTYKGESAYVCYLFFENGKITTVVYDL